MKKTIFITLITLSIFTVLFTSCESDKVETKTETTAPETRTEDSVEDEVVFVDDEEVKAIEEDEEYLRSINTMETEDVVSKSQFSEDKAEILRIIDELSDIMATKDVGRWLQYIEPESKKYYANPANLRKAQKKLPNKLIELKIIDDYFNYVFIPSRKVSRVDEIRYISSTNIKAVEVKDDNSIVVYYYFKKIDGKWLVHIPPVS